MFGKMHLIEIHGSLVDGNGDPSEHADYELFANITEARRRCGVLREKGYDVVLLVGLEPHW